MPKPSASLPQLRHAAQSCHGCDLYAHATQAVFGEISGDRDGHAHSTPHAALMLVGEQPGDQEDIQGRPFVGPAGQLLDRALAQAGVDRSRVYVTNAVKHFKWTPAPSGRRRLHRRPDPGEMRACRPWLEREIALVKPEVIVCLGVTAGQALAGRAFRVNASRGRNVPPATELMAALANVTLRATAHPSAVLRIPDHEGRERAFAELVEDLRAAAALTSKPSITARRLTRRRDRSRA